MVRSREFLIMTAKLERTQRALEKAKAALKNVIDSKYSCQLDRDALEEIEAIERGEK